MRFLSLLKVEVLLVKVVQFILQDQNVSQQALDAGSGRFIGEQGQDSVKVDF
jgi:hypothetical protein